MVSLSGFHHVHVTFPSLHSLYHLDLSVALCTCRRTASCSEESWSYKSLTKEIIKLLDQGSQIVSKFDLKAREDFTNIKRKFGNDSWWKKMLPVMLLALATVMYIGCCVVILSAHIIVISSTILGCIFDALHALAYILVHPEKVLTPITKNPVSENRAKDIINVIFAQRALFHAFSRSFPMTISACLRLVALFPIWLLALFLTTCWRYLMMSFRTVRKLSSCRGRDHESTSRDVTYIFVEFNAWTYNGTDILWASLMETLWKEVESNFGSFAIRMHRASIALSDREEVTDDDKRTNFITIGAMKIRPFPDRIQCANPCRGRDKTHVSCSLKHCLDFSNSSSGSTL